MIAGELNILAAVSWLDDLYVGTLVVGGGYLLISLLLGSFHGADAGGDAGGDLGGHDLGGDADMGGQDLGGHADVGAHDVGAHDVGADAHAGAHDAGAHDAGAHAHAGHAHDLETLVGGPRKTRVIGLRSPIMLSLLLANFGLLGLMSAGWLGVEPITLVPAGAGGLIITGGLVRLINRLAATGSPSATFTVNDLIGLQGEVAVPIKPGSVGQITFVVRGRRCSSGACTDSEQPIQRGQIVVITRVVQNRCYVVPKDA
jgi:hypothetical protein